MITLTTAEGVRQVLGNPSSLLNYDKCVADQITYSPLSKSITATLRLSVSTDATRPVLFGTLNIDANGGTVSVTFPDFKITERIPISGATLTTVQGYITTAQQQIEQGLVNISAIAGTYSGGV